MNRKICVFLILAFLYFYIENVFNEGIYGIKTLLISNCFRLRCKFSIIECIYRIHTVTGGDRILVLDTGKLAEQGHPIKLIQDSTSRYAR